MSSYTAVSSTDWWLLGKAACRRRPCTSIVRTTDGGTHFVRIPAPRVALSDRHGVSQLRFADREDGFAFDSRLYATHDGGRTWRRVRLGGPVGELAAADGYVYAVVSHGDRRTLLRSAAAGGRWTRLPAPRDLLGGLWVQGAHLFAQNQHDGAIGGRLLVSLDGGRRWSSYRVPIPGLGCEVDQVDPPVLWERCNTGMMASIWRSTDEGRTFRHEGGEDGAEFNNTMVFAAASNSVAIAGSQRLERTTDDAHHFTDVGPSGFTWSYLGFTDPMHGVGIAHPGQDGTSRGQLWATTDGGRTWHHVPIR